MGASSSSSSSSSLLPPISSLPRPPPPQVEVRHCCCDEFGDEDGNGVSDDDDGGGDDDSANSSCHKSLATPTNGFPETGAQVAPTKDYQQAKHDSSPSCECRNFARKLKKKPESHFLYMWRSTRAGLSKRNGSLGRPLPPASGGLSMGFILACVSAPVLAAAGAALPKSLAESRAARNQPNTPTTAWELARGNLRLG